MWCSTVGCIVTFTLSLLAAPLAAEAQPPTKMYRIGWLNDGFPPTDPNRRAGAFRQGLHDLGYIEGQHFVMEYRYAERSEERARDLAAELVRLKVDIIVASGGPAARGAKQATSTIPIVMVVGDALEQGLVPSLDVHFVSPVPVECHARAGGHPVPMALGPWIPAFAGMTRGHKHWQGIYEMDI